MLKLIASLTLAGTCNGHNTCYYNGTYMPYCPFPSGIKGVTDIRPAVPVVIPPVQPTPPVITPVIPTPPPVVTPPYVGVKDTITPCLDAIEESTKVLAGVSKALDEGVIGGSNEVLKREAQFNVPQTLSVQVQGSMLEIQRQVALFKDEQRLWANAILNNERSYKRNKKNYARYSSRPRAEKKVRASLLKNFATIAAKAESTEGLAGQARKLHDATTQAGKHLVEISATLRGNQHDADRERQRKIKELLDKVRILTQEGHDAKKAGQSEHRQLAQNEKYIVAMRDRIAAFRAATAKVVRAQKADGKELQDQCAAKAPKLQYDVRADAGCAKLIEKADALFKKLHKFDSGLKAPGMELVQDLGEMADFNDFLEV